MKTASPDQDLFDRLLAKKHAEVKATLRAPTVVQEFAQDMGTTVVALRQEVAERLLGMGIDPSDLRSDLIDECIERDLEAQRKQWLERRARSVPMGERTRALKRAPIEIWTDGGDKPTYVVDDPSNFEVGMIVKVGTGVALANAVQREFDAIDASIRKQHEMFNFHGPPPEEQDLAFLREEPVEEERVAFYANLHCERPGINFVLRLDDDGDDDEIVVRHQHEGATDE